MYFIITTTMKKITLLLTLFSFILSFGQGNESFTNENATGGSYGNGSFEGDSGITWTYVKSRGASASNTQGLENPPGLMLQKSSVNSKVTSSTISGGIGNFSVKVYKSFTGGGNRQVELFINGVSKGTSDAFDDYDEHIFSVDNINISGDIVIEIASTSAKQTAIDDISWTAYSTSNDLTVSSDQTISSDVSYDNVTVNAGNTLTLAKTGSLTISADFTNNGSRTELQFLLFIIKKFFFFNTFFK